MMIRTSQPTQPTQPKVFTQMFKIITKLSPEGPKMRPRGTPNDSQNQKKMGLAPKMVPSWFQEGVLSMSPAPLGGFLGPLGVPKIDQKIDFLRKWGSQGSHFIDFWGNPHCHQLFHRFILDFWPKNRCFFDRCFLILLRFFSTWRPSQNIVIYISKWTFSIFVFLVIFRKHTKKNSQKNTLKKVPKNAPLGTPWGPQNGYK